VDDDASVARLMVDLLEQAGYHVSHAENGAYARAWLRQRRPDLVVLDLMLPDMDGLLLCREIQSLYNVPLLICSGTGRRRDHALGLKLGADDFIAKPFEPAEFEARVEAVLRRARTAQPVAASSPSPAPSPTRLRVGCLELDWELERAWLNGLRLTISPTAFRLLLALARQPGKALSREDLAHQLWGTAPPASSRREIDGYVFRLRQQLANGPAGTPELRAVRNVGYQLVDSTVPFSLDGVEPTRPNDS
jgi:DNA-binding response OmpR family regulator